MVQDAFPSAEVYIVRRQVAKAFVIPLGVVPGDETRDLGLHLSRRLPHDQVDVLLAGPVVPFDLTVGLRVVRRGEDVPQPGHATTARRPVISALGLAVLTGQFSFYDLGHPA